MLPEATFRKTEIQKPLCELLNQQFGKRHANIGKKTKINQNQNSNEWTWNELKAQRTQKGDETRDHIHLRVRVRNAWRQMDINWKKCEIAVVAERDKLITDH